MGQQVVGADAHAARLSPPEREPHPGGRGAPPAPAPGAPRCGHKIVRVSTKILPESDVRPDLSHGDGDHERFAHYVEKNKIMESAISGVPVRALCGKVWVPNRDPKKFPVCPECQEIYSGLPKGEDNTNE